MVADAVDVHGSLLVSDPGVARLTQIMLRRGRRKVLMADHTKLAAQGHGVYANLSVLDVSNTTAGIDRGLLPDSRR